MTTTKKLCISGLMCALSVCLQFMSIPIFSLGGQTGRIGFHFLPIIITSAILGCFYGAVVGGAADILYSVFFLNAPYLPYLTITAALLGVIFGIICNPKYSYTKWRITLAVIVSYVICGFILNTIFLSMMMSVTIQILFVSRLIPQLINLLIYILLSNIFILYIYRNKKFILS